MFLCIVDDGDYKTNKIEGEGKNGLMVKIKYQFYLKIIMMKIFIWRRKDKVLCFGWI